MYTSKRRKQNKRRKTQRQHCFMDEALLLNYPFPNKIFNFPKYVKSAILHPEGKEMWAQMSEMERQLFVSNIQKDMKGGGLNDGSTTFEIGLAAWINYIIGLKDFLVEKIIETYKNTLPIPVIGEIVKTIVEYSFIIKIPILWFIELVSNAFTALVSTVKTNWHYVFILLTSLDLIEWAGAAVNASGVSYFSPASTISSFINNNILNFGGLVNIIWSIIVSIWTIVVYWIPSNIYMFIFSNTLFSFSIVILIFIAIFIWISEIIKPSYYIRMTKAKQEIIDIHKKLVDFLKNKSDIPEDEFEYKKEGIEGELKNAKEYYTEVNILYEADLKKRYPNKYALYNLKKLKQNMENAEKENIEALSDIKKAIKLDVKTEIDKSRKHQLSVAKKYQTAKLDYETTKAENDAAVAAAAAVAAVAPLDFSDTDVSYDSELGNPTRGGNRNTRKEKQKEIDYESIIHRLLSKKSLDNFKNISTTELEEIHKKQPFPFEIALALGFMKKTDDGYELVEKRIQKLKEPVIQSMSFLNHRCKGCKPKSHRTTQKGGSAPLEDYELDSLRESLIGVKMLHTASIYAITREAVDMEDKHKMTGGNSDNSKREPDPFLNIPKTLNQLKPTDMNWLKEKFPDDFKIAQKLGIVANGELSNSAREILQDTSEMSKSIIKKKIPKTSQKILFPRE
jgi:hypothetical protein